VTALEQKDSSMLSKIGEQFNLCDSSDLLDVGNARLFVGDGVVELDIQSNDPSCQEDLCNIEKVCLEKLKLQSLFAKLSCKFCFLPRVFFFWPTDLLGDHSA